MGRRSSVERIAQNLALRAKLQKFAHAAWVIGVILAIVGLKGEGSQPLLVAGGITVLAWLIFSVINARCPHCVSRLPWVGNFDHCRDCGLTVDSPSSGS